ncbi:Ribosomal L18 C-terminal domain-containing protein [Forsythia ovata]|uniref:Ribosomal L18 C-terminal domain-containing protein n=1 Tax=Forsythia ovata TaxID=205694 RepID=A0ABD1P6Q8_9LAMI
MEDQPEKYQTHFSEYIKRRINGDGLKELYKKVHAAIRADPTLTKSEKQPPKDHKRNRDKWQHLKISDSSQDFSYADLHMDVCFYFLRKMLRYGHGIKINATTTDFAFNSQVRGGDCGIYVNEYAEYFINEKLKEMPKTFNIAQVQKYLATQLYVYANKKQVENYDTDNDWVPKDNTLLNIIDLKLK